MDKINFVNLPSTTTPVNATNLNQIQTNVDNAKVEKSSVVSSANLNNFIDTEIHYCTGVTNGPVSSNGWAVSIKYTNTYTKQFYYPVHSNIGYERTQNNGTWGSWHIIGGETITTFSNSDLSNDWTTNGQCNGVVLPNGTKILTISVRYGTSTEVMTLPTALRPASSVGALAGASNVSGYVTIGTDGTVTASANIFSSGSSNLRFTVMYI